MPGRLPHELYPASVRARLRRLRRLVVDDSAGALVSTFTISGTVLDLDDSPLENVAVTLTGAAEDETTTDASGEYEFTGVYSGSYSINFAIDDHNDVDISFTVEGADVTDADASMIAVYTVSGTITDTDTTDPIEGAELILTTWEDHFEALDTAVTNASGVYEFLNVPDGEYRVSGNARSQGYPVLSTGKITVDGADVDDADADASMTMFKISGTFVDFDGGEIVISHTEDEGVEDVSVIVEEEGVWTSPYLDYGGPYSITPTPDEEYTGGNLITPAYRLVLIDEFDVTGVDFELLPYDTDAYVGGAITPAAAEEVVGIEVRIDGPMTTIKGSDYQGEYGILGPPGDYVITPSKEGFTFEPESIEVTVAAYEQSLENDFVITEDE